jgi:hypothetical protein
MSHYFNGTDLSIFAGAAVAASIYYPWGKRAKNVIPRVRDEAVREPASL